MLEVTVYDEDPDYKVEFLGKAAIPLLLVGNGAPKWYPLKDKKLAGPAKGNNPKILLEMQLVWNPVCLVDPTIRPLKTTSSYSLTTCLRSHFVSVVRIDTSVHQDSEPEGGQVHAARR